MPFNTFEIVQSNLFSFPKASVCSEGHEKCFDCALSCFLAPSELRVLGPGEAGGPTPSGHCCCCWIEKRGTIGWLWGKNVKWLVHLTTAWRRTRSCHWVIVDGCSFPFFRAWRNNFLSWGIAHLSFISKSNNIYCNMYINIDICIDTCTCTCACTYT